MKKFFLFTWTLSSCLLSAQTVADSTIHIREVTVIGLYPGKNPVLNSPSSISILDGSRLEEQPGASLLHALNALPGVRMEERSPGSYRLSIRGSLLRSPFGIRNIKIYLDEFPLTDAGGNTYLNLVDAGNIKKVEVLKGAEGSLFGANTGGVMRLSLSEFHGDTFAVNGGAELGSFGFFKSILTIEKPSENYHFNISASQQLLNGYRENSAFRRTYFQSIYRLDYKPQHIVKIFLFGSDLNYNTPGGLTLEQMNDYPKMARPPTGIFPGALEQKAGVFNKTIFAGIMHRIPLGDRLAHVLIVCHTNTDFKNPFITNYETRKERTGSLRTYLEWQGQNNTSNLSVGLESQRTHSDISNSGNREGIRDTLQTSDKLSAGNTFLFTRFSCRIAYRWQIETAISLNNYRYMYKKLFPVRETSYHIHNLDPELMPRIAVSYKLYKELYWRISASRGYSPPTIPEIRPSDNLFYDQLVPESGWNYETGLRFRKGIRFDLDLAIFRFDLRNTIVRRVNNQGTEYFINAGSTRQQGIEMEMNTLLLRNENKGFMRTIRLRSSFTFYDFTFINYQTGSTDFSGNILAGIPRCTVTSSLLFQFPANIYLAVYHYYTERIPLNDGNSVYAPEYNLLRMKAGWKCLLKKQLIHFFFGADNLLNEAYSLGNDLNAPGNRYYNPAPEINFSFGGSITFH